ncbi:MAG: class I SAM-dependent methyltransferase [Candidatus Bilamarchaeaceae archaeon]
MLKEVSQDEMYKSKNPIIRYFHNRRLDMIVKLLGDTAGKKILDVGCGDGFLLDKLRGKLFGVDVSPKRVKTAKERLGDKATIIIADARKLPFRDQFFDVVVCSEVLEHIRNPDLVISEIFRVTKNGGVAIITVPNEQIMCLGRLLMLKFPIKIPDHINSFKIADIERIIGAKADKVVFIPPVGEYICLFKLMRFRKKNRGFQCSNSAKK